MLLRAIPWNLTDDKTSIRFGLTYERRSRLIKAIIDQEKRRKETIRKIKENFPIVLEKQLTIQMNTVNMIRQKLPSFIRKKQKNMRKILKT